MSETQVGVREVGDLISERAARFKGGLGMVLILQEGRRVRLYFFNGNPKVSYSYTNEQLSLSSEGQRVLDKSPVEMVLKSGEDAKFALSLQAKFSKYDSTSGPLWRLDPSAWDYQVMKLQHQYDFGIRISFGVSVVKREPGGPGLIERIRRLLPKMRQSSR